MTQSAKLNRCTALWVLSTEIARGAARVPFMLTMEYLAIHAVERTSTWKLNTSAAKTCVNLLCCFSG